MPYESESQRRFFQGCKHNPGSMRGKCPAPKVIEKFEAHKGTKRKALPAPKRKKK